MGNESLTRTMAASHHPLSLPFLQKFLRIPDVEMVSQYLSFPMTYFSVNWCLYNVLFTVRYGETLGRTRERKIGNQMILNTALFWWRQGYKSTTFTPGLESKFQPGRCINTKKKLRCQANVSGLELIFPAPKDCWAVWAKLGECDVRGWG